MILQTNTASYTRDLVTFATLLNVTPDATNHMLAKAYIKFPGGDNDLDGSGGNFELKITVGGKVIQPNPTVINFDSSAECAFWTKEFIVGSGEVVLIELKSPNSADEVVDVVTELYNIETVLVDSAGRVNVGEWLGTAVTLSSGAPDVNIQSIDSGVDLSATQKTSVNTQVDLALSDVNLHLVADGSGRVNVGRWLSVAVVAADIPTAAEIRIEMDANSKLVAIELDTAELQVDNVPGLIAALPTAVEITGHIDANSTKLVAIELDTNELQVDNVPGLIAALPTGVEIVTALMADTGFTAGGTTTFADFLKIMAAWAAGNVRDKSGSTGVVEYLDLDDGTVVYEIDWETTTPYRSVTLI